MTKPTNPGLYVDELPAGGEAISDVPTSLTAFVGSTSNGPVNEPTRVRSIAEFERVFGAGRVDLADGASLTMPLAIGSFFENSGTDAVVVRASGQIVPPPGTGAGIYALDRVDAFNLLCLPDLTAEFSGNAGGIATALTAASAYCEARRAILIVDSMPGWRSVTDVVSGTSGVEAIGSALRRANAVLYFPAVVTEGRDGGPPIECPPSGAVAGVIARTDATQGVWRAPAGETAVIAGIVGLALSLSDDEVDRLSAVGVNALRTVPSERTVIWGARTFEGAAASEPEWKYINIRRLALFLEQSIDCGLRWVVFEPNDEPLWAAIRTSVGDFLSSLHRRGAFQGATARERYFVKCGRDTMSRDEIDSGVVNVIIGFAVVRPAEFIVARIRQTAQGTTGQHSPAMLGDDRRYGSLRYAIRSHGRIVAAFRDAAGLPPAHPVVDDGQETRGTARSEWDAITLEHGVTYDPGFNAWARSTPDATFARGAPAFAAARASEYDALAELDAPNAALVEHLKLENEGWDRDPGFDEPRGGEPKRP